MKEKLEKLKNKGKEIIDKGKAKLAKGKQKVGDFVVNHPELVIPVAALGISVVGGAINTIAKAGDLEGCRVKDDVTELELLTKHPLTNSEILELNQRMIDGDPKAQALDDMGLLRKEKKRKR